MKGFLKIFSKFKFKFKIWQTFIFCTFHFSVHFQGDIFRSTSCILIFTIATIFARDPRQQYPFVHKCNSTLNALSSIANQTASLPLAMRFLNIVRARPTSVFPIELQCIVDILMYCTVLYPTHELCIFTLAESSS